MSNYRLANTKTQWFQGKFPGSNLSLKASELKVVLHSTEGTSWPGYGGGSSAPNYTGMPPLGTKSGTWRAHFPDEKSSRALRNLAGGVETNTDDAIQIELIGTCDPKHKNSWDGQGKRLAGRDYVYWPNATRRQLKWLARLLADLHTRHGLRLSAPKTFKAYPSSYGNNGVRFSHAGWKKATGVVGHQHVPENTHGDPGNIDITRCLKIAKKIANPKVKVAAKVTRGPRIDAAIKELNSSKGSGKRGKAIKAALKTLLEVKPLKK